MPKVVSSSPRSGDEHVQKLLALFVVSVLYIHDISILQVSHSKIQGPMYIESVALFCAL